MRKSGPIMYVIDNDPFIDKYFDPAGIRYQQPGDRFEIDHLEEALKYVKNFRTAIDGGAYYGSWARYMALEFDHVWAFEPVADIYACLDHNTRHFGNIAILRIALGETFAQVSVGKGKMYHHPGMETVTEGVLPPFPLHPSIEGESWGPMMAVDGINLPDLDFLKLDIEGYEYFALQGALKTLARCHPVVLFEENVRGKLEHGVEIGSCGKLLVDLGAELVARIGSDHIYAWRD